VPDPAASDPRTLEPSGQELRVEVLGEVRAFRGDRELQLGPPRQRAVLAMLTLRANRVVSRDELVDGGCGTDPPASVVNRVHAHVAALRRIVEPDRARRAPGQVLASVGSGYRLTLAPGQLDAEVFATRLDSARRLAAAGDRARALDAYTAALALWQGPPLADVPGPFAQAERARLVELRLTAAEERAAVLLRTGAADPDLIPELSALVVENPLRERLRALLMVALHRAGRPAEALAVFADTRRVLVEELGVEPGPPLQRLHRELLAGEDVALDSRSAPAVTPTVVPRQLPPPPRHFAGRRVELRALTALLGDPAGAGRTFVISAIDGTAGIGKTTLAVYWAHQVAARFPDGQLYVNLRGFDPAGEPMEPGEAVRGFLDALGVPPQRIPTGIDAQAGRYRTLLADRRVLVVLDNAADVAQVRPLLPNSPTALVLVTSRHRLTGLVAAQGARPLALDLLTAADAHELLVRHLGAERVAAEPEAAQRIVARCAGLPIALSVLAARAATRPDLRLAELVAELDEARDGLDPFDTGDRAMDVRSVFSWSYRRLSAPAARLFRLLGLHPGPEVGVPAAASVAGVPAGQAGAALAELARAHLVEERSAGRFAGHDLLRAYATELAQALDSPAERRAAVHRALDHYLHTAAAGAQALAVHRRPIPAAPAQPGVTPEALGSPAAAMAWFAAEHRVLVTAIALAGANGFDAHAWQLASALTHFQERNGLWSDWEASQHAALAAAQRLGDRAAEARTRRSLAGACARQGRYQEAHAHLAEALRLFEEIGDRVGEARTTHLIAQAFAMEGRYRPALDHALRALEIYQVAGYQAGHAAAINSAGWYHAQLGDYRQALEYSERARALQVQLRDPHNEAETLVTIGYARHRLGEHDLAARSYREAIDLYRETADPYNQADCLNRLGDTYAAAGDTRAARRSWVAAVAILDELDHPDADEIRGKLTEPDRVR
jgi:DNA-binding SARP family transcriptional activator/tetratricopeptide (TPR) repeat protein